MGHGHKQLERICCSTPTLRFLQACLPGNQWEGINPYTPSGFTPHPIRASWQAGGKASGTAACRFACLVSCFLWTHLVLVGMSLATTSILGATACTTAAAPSAMTAARAVVVCAGRHIATATTFYAPAIDATADTAAPLPARRGVSCIRTAPETSGFCCDLIASVSSASTRIAVGDCLEPTLMLFCKSSAALSERL